VQEVIVGEAMLAAAEEEAAHLMEVVEVVA